MIRQGQCFDLLTGDGIIDTQCKDGTFQNTDPIQDNTSTEVSVTPTGSLMYHFFAKALLINKCLPSIPSTK